MPKVVFSISANGKDVTENLRDVLISMTITDSEGVGADTLSLVIDDLDGSVEPPTRGVILSAKGGYEGRVRDFGLFSVDTVGYTGWPQQITVSAQSLAAKELAKVKEPKSFPKKDFPTYGDVFQAVAKAVSLPLVMAARIAGVPNYFEAQAEESAMEFLTRIGETLNASVTIKSGQIVVMEKGSGVGAGGSVLQTLRVSRPGNLLGYSVGEKDEPRYGNVETTTYDRAKNERKTVIATTGLEGPTFRIRAPFQTEEDAKRAAEAKTKELIRAQGEASFTIDGEPFAQAEAFADVRGVRSRVDGLWKVKTATHNFTGSAAYTTELQCEVPSP